MNFPKKKQVKVRFLVAFSAWFALLVFYIHRSNVSVAILEMVNVESNSKSFSQCINKNHSKADSKIKKPFYWTQSQVGIVLGSFFYGYASMHFLGGLASARFGPRIILAICLFGSSISQFISPVLAKQSATALIIARILSGLFSGPLYPVVHEIVGSWSPTEERTILAVGTHTGNMFGLMINFGIGGFISQSGNNGWEIFFYVSGIFGIVSLIIWTFCAFDNPYSHPYIHQTELDYITKDASDSGGHHVALKDVPFKQIFSSIPVWTCHLAHFGSNFLLYSLLTGHPKFLKDVYGVSTNKASLLSVIPFVVSFIVQVIWPNVADYLISKKGYKRITIRKFSSGFGFIWGSFFLMCVGTFPCDKIGLAVGFVCLSMIGFGFNTSGYFTSIIDMAPKYAGIIMGISNTFGSIAGFTNPLLASSLTKSGDKKLGWMYTFIATGAISLLFGIPYLIFGTSDLQKWATNNSDHNANINSKDTFENIEMH